MQGRWEDVGGVGGGSSGAGSDVCKGGSGKNRGADPDNAIGSSSSDEVPKDAE